MTNSPAPPATGAPDDLIGMDKLARAFIKVVVRMPPASLVAVHGAPGAGKGIFMHRVAYLVKDKDERASLGLPDPSAIFPGAVFYNPWTYARQGHMFAGLVTAVARWGASPHILFERARDVMSQVTRMRFDGSQSSTPGPAFTEADMDPLDRFRNGFSQLVEAAKGGRPGRLLIFVEDLDRLSPSLRWEMLDGLRLLLTGGADVTVVVSIGREAAIDAVRARDGNVPEESASRSLSEVIDLSISVPNLDVRRISSLLRRYIGDGESVLRGSFGNDAVMGLSAAVAHRPLGSPRFLEQLAYRVVLLAEYAQEVRAMRELSEAQWAWVIISVRWPAFRRYMIRGGRERWLELKHAVSRLSQRSPDAAAGGRSGITDWLEGDLILAGYLRLHADGFERDSEGIFWLENLLLASGL